MARPTRAIAAVAGANVVSIEAGGSAETLVESYKRLAEVFHDVLSEESLDALLARIAGTLAELVPYDALHVYEADEERGVLTPILARSAWYEEEIMRSRPRFGEGLTGWAVENRRPVWTNRAHLDPRVVNIPGTPVEPEALITIPLVARGSLKGALNIYRLGDDGAFFEHEFELAKWFGDAAALAMDNAQIRMRLEHLAQTDSLTGLCNHRYFHERLRAELTRASRCHDSIALLMLDLDDFKRVNDIYGHSIGDQLLVQVARVTKETVRASDVACRIGGEEFAVIMPSCDTEAALGLAARLTERISEIDVDPVHSVTISIGVAQGPQQAASPRELIGCAEAAMMTAKARGKNQAVFYEEHASERPDAEAAGRDLRSIGHLKLLQSLAGKLNRLNDVQQIGATIATELRQLIDYHNCRVFLRDGEQLDPIAFVGDFDVRLGSAADVYATVVGVGITGWVVESGESLLVPNALECEYAKPVPNTEELDESIAAVPLRYGSRVTGAIVISKLGLNQFDEDDIRLLEVLAGQASVALENARLYDEQRREAINAKALLAFLDEVSRAQSFNEICTRTVETAATLFGSPAVSLWLQDAAGEFNLAASAGSTARVDGRLTGDNVSALVSQGHEPFRGEAAIVAPLLEGEGVTGWIAVAKDDPAAASDAELRLLAAFSYQASVALQKARLYWQQLEAAEIANALLDASRELATADSPEAVLARTVEVTARVVGAERASLWMQEDDPPHNLVARAWFGGTFDDLRAPIAGGRAEKWLQLLEPFALEPEQLAHITGLPVERFSRLVVAPLRLENGRAGALVATIGGRELGERRLRLLAGLAHQAKLAIESSAHYETLERTFVSTVEALANALEANDAYTSSHARWITDMALLVGRELGLDRRSLKRLEFGALFHDIGKIGIPSEILRKPGPLTEAEFAIVKEHPELGERILAPIERLAEVRPIVRACHERWDGLGYPDGKAGTDIPVESRIVLVCDAYHAMVTDRPYRMRLPIAEAVRRIEAASGTQFDPTVVDAFVRLYAEGEVSPV
jgi:diguanylate cyclase (GGDEF)-like protein